MGGIATLIDQPDRYAVVDVETANSDRSSICAIGLVLVEEGRIQDTHYSLVNPFTEFSRRNIEIHGITETDVLAAPRFSAVWPAMLSYLKDRTLVCYNAAFDVHALMQASQDAMLPIISLRYLCALQLARRLLPLPSHRLTAVAEHFGISYAAHNALEDALATHAVLEAMKKHHEAANLHSLAHIACLPYSYTDKTDYKPADKGQPRKSSYEASQEPLQHGNSKRFLGKSVVFSGNLSCAPRAIARNAVTEMGGICRDHVTSKTDILIIGFYDQSTLLPGCTLGLKAQKAYDMRSKGHPIEILDENDFMLILREGLE